LIPKGSEGRHLEVFPHGRKAAEDMRKSSNTTTQKASENGCGTKFKYSSTLPSWLGFLSCFSS